MLQEILSTVLQLLAIVMLMIVVFVGVVVMALIIKGIWMAWKERGRNDNID